MSDVAEVKISAVMSMPRLAFTENMHCCMEALPPLGIQLRTHTGAFWSQSIERAIATTIEQDKPDAVLTIDYDTVFSRRDVSVLMQIMRDHRNVDAVAAIQSRRGKELPMFTIKDANGQTISKAGAQTFAPDIIRAASAHFGLTLLRAEKFKALPRPWFQDIPAPDNTWGVGRQDADSAFWQKWALAGNSLFIANRVPVGHLELMIQWPGKNLKSIYQTTDDFYESGISIDAWR